MRTLLLLIALLIGFHSVAVANSSVFEKMIFKEARAKAEQGDAGAQTALGEMYDLGRGISQDYAEALKWYRLAAAQGDARAQTNLGLMYYKGQVVPQDLAEAAMWISQAAEQGDTPAQFNLGVMYKRGQGVPQDVVQAYKWVDLAVSKLPGPQRDIAQKKRDEIAAQMTPAQIAEAQKLAREWKPTAPKP